VIDRPTDAETDRGIDDVLEARLRDLERRVGALEGARSVREVMARYGFFVDTWRDEEFVALFAPDGVYEFSDPAAPVAGPNRKQGSGELLAHVTNPAGHHSPEIYGREMYCQCLNLVVHADGDRADAVSYSIVVRAADRGGVRIHAAGNSRWEMVATDGRWQIASRERRGLGEDAYATNIERADLEPRPRS
jgi:hypothetical protein